MCYEALYVKFYTLYLRLCKARVPNTQAVDLYLSVAC